MCDLHTLEDDKRHLLSRRRFNTLTAATGLAAVLPRAANAQDVVESDVEVSTPDGLCDSYFVHPATGRHPAIIVWPDILGLRPTFRAMGKRLAESGYAVLVINPFYRNARAPVVGEGANFQDDSTRNIVMPMAGALSPETHFTDARAFVEFLDQQGVVDTSRGIGTTGYCMGGSMVMRTAAVRPDRVRAGASFHGAGLANDSENSPHRLIPEMQADMLYAIAVNDDERSPDEKHLLRAAHDEAGSFAEIEVYEDALHGWCVPGSAAYHEAQAERAWSRMLSIFERALA